MEISSVNNTYYGLISFTIILFLFNPLSAIFLFFLIVQNTPQNKDILFKKSSLLILCLMLTVFVSSVNVTKVPSNDLEWYIESYQRASDYNLLTYMIVGSSPDFSESGKEPLYGLFVWIMNRLYDGNISLFKFSMSMLSYLFLTMPFVKIATKYNKIDFRYVLYGLMLMCFIPYIFTMSLHLIRQFIAGAILIYVSVDKCFFNKNNYILLLAMPLVHTSSLLFIPFLLLPFLSENIFKQKKLYLLLSITIAFYPLFAKVISSLGLFTNIGAVEYAISRVSNEDKTSSLGSFTPMMIALLLLVISFSYYMGYKGRFCNDSGIKRFFHLQLFLSLFIIVNLSDLEIANRFYFYLFPFVALDFIFLFDRLKLNKFTINSIVLFMMIFFTTYLYWGAWVFKLNFNPWLQPIYIYFE